MIDFTDDLDVVESVLDGEFNSFTHFCGFRYSVVQTCVAVNGPRQLVVTMPGEVDTEFPEEWSRSSIDAYEDLRDVFAEWLTFEIAQLWEEMTNDSFSELSSAEKPKVVSAIGLLAFHRLVTGMRVSGQTTEELASVERFARLHDTLILGQVDRVILDSLETGRLADVVDDVRRHIPSRCLTDGVLTGLVDRCDDAAFEVTARSTDDGDTFKVLDRVRLATAYRFELAAAVAHHLAGRTSPRVASWATMVVGVWALSTLERTDIDARAFLSPAVLQATTDFDDIASAAMSLMLPDGPTTFDDAMAAVSALRAKFAPFMERAGYAHVFDELIDGLYARMLRDSGLQLPISDALDGMLNQLVHVDQLDDPRETAQSAGQLAAMLLARIASAQPEKTASTAREIRDYLVETHDVMVLAAFTFEATEWLNLRGFHDIALELVEPILPLITDVAAELGQIAEVNFWNEIGNTYRYAYRLHDAIAAYDRSEAAIHGLPDAERRHRVNRLNVAIVLRDSGEISEALGLMDEMLDATSNDASLLHTAAVTHELIGEFEEALQLLGRMESLPDLSLHDKVLATATRVEVLIRLDRAERCSADLYPLWRLPELEADQRMRIAALAVQVPARDGREAAFRNACVQHIDSQADRLEGAPAVVAALYALTVERLKVGELEAARAALERAIPEPRSASASRPADLDLAWGWLRLEEGGDDALTWLRSAMATLDSRLPRAEQRSYALGWMSLAGSTIDQLVDLVPRATSDPRVLLELYELANGLELTAGIADQRPALGTDWAAELAKHVGERPIDVMALIDGGTLTAVLVRAGTSEAVVIDIPLSAHALAMAVRQLAWFDLANPIAPQRVDGAMRSWWDAMEVFAGSIRPHLTDGAELIVLPGRRLAGTPLHAVGWPADPLVATRPVSACPNFRVLLDQSGSPRPRHAGIIVIPKRGDHVDFTYELEEFAAELSHLLDPATGKFGAEADAEAVLSLAEDVDEIVFLTHGVSASGPNQGAGICVSARGTLPPDVLPVDADPTLEDFVLSWADLIRISDAPAVVVSIACSSGRVLIGPGGSRLGLEQGFLTRGGTAIVSPLWNVSQSASLSWLRGFYPHHRPGDVADLSAAVRAACQDVMTHYAHPYHWAPFLLTRRLDGVKL